MGIEFPLVMKTFWKHIVVMGAPFSEASLVSMALPSFCSQSLNNPLWGDWKLVYCLHLTPQLAWKAPSLCLCEDACTFLPVLPAPGPG